MVIISAMRLTAVHHFLAVARLGGIRRAAHALGLSQPALTKSLRRLEMDLGSPLLARTVKGVALTPFGERFLKRAQLIASEIERAEEEMAQLRGELEGTVRISVSPAAAISLLPLALMRFRARFPNVKLHVADVLYPTVTDNLRSGLLDFALGPYPLGPVTPDLEIVYLFENRSVIVVRKGHPLARAKSVKELWDGEWIFAATSEGPGSVMAELFSDLGLGMPNVQTRTDSFLPLVPLIAETNLIGVIPEQVLSNNPAAGQIAVVRVKEPLHVLKICLIKRRDHPLTPAAHALMENVRWVARLSPTGGRRRMPGNSPSTA